jgi:hypothetical protein
VYKPIIGGSIRSTVAKRFEAIHFTTPLQKAHISHHLHMACSKLYMPVKSLKFTTEIHLYEHMWIFARYFQILCSSSKTNTATSFLRERMAVLAALWD